MYFFMSSGFISLDLLLTYISSRILFMSSSENSNSNNNFLKSKIYEILLQCNMLIYLCYNFLDSLI